MYWFNFFNKKKKPKNIIEETPWINRPWLNDYAEWFKNCSHEQLNDYILEEVNQSNQKTVDYATGYLGFGHNLTDKMQISDVVWRFTGVYSGVGIIGNHQIKKGDVLLVRLEDNKIGEYLILYYEKVKKSSDMFYAYVVSIGYHR